MSACSDTYDAPDELCDASWYTSQTMKNGTLDRYVVAKGDYITFMDVSQGALTHEWQIETPNVFLNDEVDVNADLEEQINTDLGTINTADVSTVLFFKPGMNTVTLHNTFSSPVTAHSKFGDISTTEVNGEHVFNKTFKVDVFDDLAPAFEVQDKEGNTLYSFTAEEVAAMQEKGQFEKLVITAGSSLTFIDHSEQGRPNSRIWTTPAGRPESGQTESYKTFFYRTGEYSNLTMTSKRLANDSVPQGATMVKVPLTIQVDPSDEDYIISDATPDDDNANMVHQTGEEMVEFVTTGVVDASTLAAAAGDFTLHIVNTRVYPAVEKDITITGVQPKIGDDMAIQLILTEPIYQDDVATLSYGGTAVKSLDGRDLLAFADKTITPLAATNVMLDLDGNSYGSFEVEQTNNIAWCWWTAQKANFKRSLEQAADGNVSMMVQATAPMSGNATVQTVKVDGDFYFSHAPGTYSVRMKVYVDPYVANTDVKFYTLLKVNAAEKLTWDLSDVTKGTWVQLPAQTMTFTKDEQQFKIQIQGADVSDEFRFFIDDIEIVPARVRPGDVAPTEPEEPEEPQTGANILLDKDGDSYGGFDKLQGNNLAWGWFCTNTYKEFFKRSTEQKASGEASLCIETSGSYSGKAALMTPKVDGEFLFQPPVGTYSLKMKVYVDSSVANAKVTFNTECRNNGQVLTWDATSVAKDQWVELPAQDIVISNAEQQFKITATQGNFDGPAKFYIDDIQLLTK